MTKADFRARMARLRARLRAAIARARAAKAAAGALALAALAGCSTVERRQEMSFRDCSVYIGRPGAGADADAGGGEGICQMMSADHGDGAETAQPTVSPATTATVSVPRGGGASALGAVADAVAGALSGGSSGEGAADGCADGSCGVGAGQ